VIGSEDVALFFLIGFAPSSLVGLLLLAVGLIWQLRHIMK